MVLDATISARALAGLLRVPSWQVERRIAVGDLPSWSMHGSRPRVGWRTARAAIVESLDPDAARVALAELRRLRAGELAVVTGPEPPTFVEADIDMPLVPVLDEDEATVLIHRAAKELRTLRLTRALFNNWAHESGQTGVTAARICAALGKPWSTIIDDLGFTPLARPSDSSLTDDEVLQHVRDAANDTPGNLSGAKFNDWAATHGVPVTAALVRGRFGSWNRAKQLANVAVRRRRTTASDDDLLACLAEAVATEPAITAAQFDEVAEVNGWDVNASLCASRFGSWNAAKARVGGTPRPAGFRGHIGPADRNGDRNVG